MNDGGALKATTTTAPTFVQLASLLALSLLWPITFLTRTLLALYLPEYRLWFALYLALGSILVYYIRLPSSWAKTPPVGVVPIAVLDCIQNVVLMIGSGCLPAPLSCLIPLTHVHMQRRPASVAAVAVSAVGVALLIAASFRSVRFAYLSLLFLSPLCMALSTACRVRLLHDDDLDSFTLQLYSSILQIPSWMALYPATAALQAVVRPLPTKFHPVSSALFESPDPIFVSTVVIVVVLMFVDFAIMMKFGAAGSSRRLQYATRGCDLLIAPSASPKQVEMAVVAGAGLGFVVAGLMVPQHVNLMVLALGATLFLVGCAMQFLAKHTQEPPCRPIEEFDLPLMPIVS